MSLGSRVRRNFTLRLFFRKTFEPRISSTAPVKHRARGSVPTNASCQAGCKGLRTVKFPPVVHTGCRSVLALDAITHQDIPRSRTGASNGQEAFNASATGASPRFQQTLGGKKPRKASRLAGR
jgi:hypothetical protein